MGKGELVIFNGDDWHVKRTWGGDLLGESNQISCLQSREIIIVGVCDRYPTYHCI